MGVIGQNLQSKDEKWIRSRQLSAPNGRAEQRKDQP
jgi:hypothetical protein